MIQNRHYPGGALSLTTHMTSVTGYSHIFVSFYFYFVISPNCSPMNNIGDQCTFYWQSTFIFPLLGVQSLESESNAASAPLLFLFLLRVDNFIIFMI